MNLTDKELKALAPVDFFDDRPGAGEVPEYNQMVEWARETGGLPIYSARPFARWMEERWYDFSDDPDSTTTVEQVLRGGVEDWCGGRPFDT